MDDYLGTRIRKGDNDTITFTPADASRPFLTENDRMWRIFAPDLRRRLSDLQASATVSDRVRAALNETLPAGDPSIGAVTAQLATSARTLQRQLSQEGTSFQAVLADTRENLATFGDLTGTFYLVRRAVRPSDGDARRHPTLSLEGTGVPAARVCCPADGRRGRCERCG